MKNKWKVLLKYVCIFFVLLSSSIIAGEITWPVLKTYDQNHISKIALPVGGIGTGTVSMAGNGMLRDWEIMNRPAKGYWAGPGGNQIPFFAIYTKTSSGSRVTRGLMGPISLADYESADGTGAPGHGIPRFRNCSFAAAYPFGQVKLSDPEVPVEVTMKMYNPLIPTDADNSGIPIAIIRYEITNLTDELLDISVSGNMENFIGEDGSKKQADWRLNLKPYGAKANKNEYKKNTKIAGIYMYSNGVPKDSEAWGTMALTTSATNDISYRTASPVVGWGGTLLDLWDDFSDDGRLTEKDVNGGDKPLASLAVSRELKPRSSTTVEFYLTWHFPNRIAWASEIVGNYYTEQFENAWDVAEMTYTELPKLEEETVEFVNAFCESDLPDVVKEAALFNLSTLRSQTSFRTSDGLFYGWEGCNDNSGCCQGSCTHVWNYEQATAFLFGDLAKMMREVEFGKATNAQGLMSFRVNLPIDYAQGFNRAAADGQMGTIMKIYRDWQLSGDMEFLKSLWPNVKNALEFCWIEGGWDGDVDGVMEGRQHNTMDVEYYGANPQMQLWYLGALRAGEEMANAMGDGYFSAICRTLFFAGSEWTDANLFNGEYYKQIIELPEDESMIAAGLSVGMGAGDLKDPMFQLGNGCLVDQLVGQYMAHVCGLGYLVKSDNSRKTLQSILKYNYRENMSGHFNNMRSYALGNEAALLMASFPHDRPKNPFPYFNEVMTGFEYTAAIGMLYEGMTEEGLMCITNIRDRYDGLKRSPFDEAECGHHYARAMASWASVLALTGFQYSAVEKSMNFDAIDGTYFWATGHAYGQLIQKESGNEREVSIIVLNGQVNIKKFVLNKFGIKSFPEPKKIGSGEKYNFKIIANNSEAGKRAYPKSTNDNVNILLPPKILFEGKLTNRMSFTDELTIELAAADQGLEIYYTLDSTEPNLKSNKYVNPIRVSTSGELRVVG